MDLSRVKFLPANTAVQNRSDRIDPGIWEQYRHGILREYLRGGKQGIARCYNWITEQAIPGFSPSRTQLSRQVKKKWKIEVPSGAVVTSNGSRASQKFKDQSHEELIKEGSDDDLNETKETEIRRSVAGPNSALSYPTEVISSPKRHKESTLFDCLCKDSSQGLCCSTAKQKESIEIDQGLWLEAYYNPVSSEVSRQDVPNELSDLKKQNKTQKKPEDPVSKIDRSTIPNDAQQSNILPNRLKAEIEDTECRGFPLLTRIFRSLAEVGIQVQINLLQNILPFFTSRASKEELLVAMPQRVLRLVRDIADFFFCNYNSSLAFPLYVFLWCYERAMSNGASIQLLIYCCLAISQESDLSIVRSFIELVISNLEQNVLSNIAEEATLKKASGLLCRSTRFERALLESVSKLMVSKSTSSSNRQSLSRSIGLLEEVSTLANHMLFGCSSHGGLCSFTLNDCFFAKHVTKELMKGEGRADARIPGSIYFDSFAHQQLRGLGVYESSMFRMAFPNPHQSVRKEDEMLSGAWRPLVYFTRHVWLRRALTWCKSYLQSEPAMSKEWHFLRRLRHKPSLQLDVLGLYWLLWERYIASAVDDGASFGSFRPESDHYACASPTECFRVLASMLLIPPFPSRRDPELRAILPRGQRLVYKALDAADLLLDMTDERLFDFFVDHHHQMRDDQQSLDVRKRQDHILNLQSMMVFKRATSQLRGLQGKANDSQDLNAIMAGDAQDEYCCVRV
ncbi:hypothetical protein BT63DRAFT_438769 [Microthyrium microscopicum]|uniref:Clr5 domain-containing protein n=1 Tax=Microthyrium microscopicum TaxID=703497 RepID=A0A6A6UG82_9PEZI|nr:hypothetical protein BT63DRAFT_438769 [Microthyrium microscopicum]